MILSSHITSLVSPDTNQTNELSWLSYSNQVDIYSQVNYSTNDDHSRLNETCALNSSTLHSSSGLNQMPDLQDVSL